MCWHVVCSAPCRAEKASRHAQSTARMLATHRACCAILSPSQPSYSSAGPAFPAPTIALASMIQVTTAKMVSASFTCTSNAFITDIYFEGVFLLCVLLLSFTKYSYTAILPYVIRREKFKKWVIS
jgi:hypothetical protein